eukprot:GFYU01002752.1.p1 GENE.GFYU01002752.1~~GFYU01002752.1.p1  ORF type:complete len:755 (-),score=220.97 GFYU01002752.1:183-2447(-)
MSTGTTDTTGTPTTVSGEGDVTDTNTNASTTTGPPGPPGCPPTTTQPPQPPPVTPSTASPTATPPTVTPPTATPSPPTTAPPVTSGPVVAPPPVVPASGDQSVGSGDAGDNAATTPVKPISQQLLDHTSKLIPKAAALLNTNAGKKSDDIVTVEDEEDPSFDLVDVKPHADGSDAAAAMASGHDVTGEDVLKMIEGWHAMVAGQFQKTDKGAELLHKLDDAPVNGMVLMVGEKEMKSTELSSMCAEKIEQLLASGKSMLAHMDENPQISQTAAASAKALEDVSQLEASKKLMSNSAAIFENLSQRLQQGLKEVQGSRPEIYKEIMTGKFSLKDTEGILRHVQTIGEDVDVTSLVGQWDELVGELQRNESAIALWNEGSKLLDEYRANNKDVDEIINTGLQVADEVQSTAEYNELVEKGQKAVADTLLAASASKPLDQMAEGIPVDDLVESGKKVIVTVSSTESGRALMQKGQEIVESLMSSKTAVWDQIQSLINDNEAFIDDLKNRVIPWVRDQILTLEIPPLEGIFETGSVAYRVKDVVLSGLTIPPEGLSVEVMEQKVKINLLDISAVIKQFSWWYKQGGFPYLGDDGEASASVTKGGCVAVLGLEFDENNMPILKVDHIFIKFEKIDIEVMGEGTASWIYNTIIYLLSDVIREGIEAKVEGVLNESLSSLTQLLTSVLKDFLPAFSPAAEQIEDGSGDTSPKNDIATTSESTTGDGEPSAITESGTNASAASDALKESQASETTPTPNQTT